MAKCDQGYLCEVCGQPVEDITDSDLYLRYIAGEVSIRDLPRAPERHIRCNPTQAQFIVDPAFEAVFVEGAFDKRNLDSADVDRREARATAAWRRLQEVRRLRIPIEEYPLENA
jgi:hypothetical protein